MKPFSFVHVADLHLGYAQYNLDVRRQDFRNAFREVVDKTLELKPDFMIVAGDLFHHARPSNVTLETAITNFRRLKEAGIAVLAVDGGHDAAPNVVTGTILNPLDSAGLIYYLPRHEGACWRNESCYVYGVPNYRTRRRTEEQLPLFLEQKKPSPDPSLFNIFVFHMALELPSVTPSYIEAEASPELIPEGFNYFAGGHVHKPSKGKFKDGLLVYSGCTETVSYEDAEIKKGFYHVEVNEKGVSKLNRIRLESPRRFVVLKHDFSNVLPAKITEMAVQLVKEADEEGVIIVPVLEGVLPAEANRSEVDITQIRNAAEKALLVRPLSRLQEVAVSEEVIRSIFEGELKDMKTKAFEYFLQIFSERYGRKEAEKISRLAVNILEPLVRKDEDKVRDELEAFMHED
ncbi:MAG: exonuclease SbcCD subunit D [Candidatus Bathyarchaeia archaeon]